MLLCGGVVIILLVFVMLMGGISIGFCMGVGLVVVGVLVVMV